MAQLGESFPTIARSRCVPPMEAMGMAGMRKFRAAARRSTPIPLQMARLGSARVRDLRRRSSEVPADDIDFNATEPARMQIFNSTKNVLSKVVGSISLALKKRIAKESNGAESAELPTETEPTLDSKHAAFWETAEKAYVLVFSDKRYGEMIYYNEIEQKFGKPKEVIVAFKTSEAAQKFALKIAKTSIDKPGEEEYTNGKVLELPPKEILGLCRENGMYVTVQEDEDEELPRFRSKEDELQAQVASRVPHVQHMLMTPEERKFAIEEGRRLYGPKGTKKRSEEDKKARPPYDPEDEAERLVQNALLRNAILRGLKGDGMNLPSLDKGLRSSKDVDAAGGDDVESDYDSYYDSYDASYDEEDEGDGANYNDQY